MSPQDSLFLATIELVILTRTNAWTCSCICTAGVNTAELEKLRGREKTYYASISGEVSNQDKAVSDALSLKVGARVMSVVNGSPYYNGSLGTVVALEKDGIEVDFDDVGSAHVGPHTFEIARPSLVDGRVKQETIGTITQLPLKLAWAITIHKAQGQTFEAAHIYPECWDAGQLYTALSRLTDISGLSLAHPINESFLKTLPEVIKFLEGNHQAPDWDRLSE